MPRSLGPLQCNEIERTGVIPAECSFQNPTLHLCPDWDFLLIDDSDPEFETCTCNRED
jgi:hypothetical protein